MSALLELAERCEKATGPDRKLDAEIDWTKRGEAGAWYVAESYSGEFSHVSGWWRDADNLSHKAPDYTASLDAALTLVPDAWESAACGRTDDGRGWAHLAHNDGHMMSQDPDEFFVEADAATPALALCAAALRARLSPTEANDRKGLDDVRD